MNYEEAKEYIVHNPGEWLTRDGSGEGYICPICGSGSGKTGTGLRRDPGSKTGTHWKCFACNFYGDMVDFSGAEHGIVPDGKRDTAGYRRAFEAARENYGITVDRAGTDYRPPERKAVAAAARYKVSVDATPHTEKPTGGEIGAIRNRLKDFGSVRSCTLEEIKTILCSGGTVQPCEGVYLLNPARTNQHGEPVQEFRAMTQQLVFVDIDNEKNGVPVENPLTMERALGMSAERGVMPFMVYPSFSNMSKGYEKFRLCFALDEAVDIGWRGAVTIDAIKRFMIEPFSAYNDSAADKDLNRLYFGTNAEPYYFDERQRINCADIITRIKAGDTGEIDQDVANGENALDTFLESISSERYKPVPTGIADLDKRLGGGVINGWLVLIGAEPGAGKTALTSQILENWAADGRQCVYINLEMSVEQMLARSLSRALFVADGTEMTALQIMRGYEHTVDDKRNVARAADVYRRKYAHSMLYNPDDTGTDIDKILESLERRAQRAEAEGKPAPIVALDYLQYVTGQKGEDDVAALKRALQGMKDYAKNHNTIAFCIMAQSRAANSSDKATMTAGRDTSNLEYTADLQLQLIKEKDQPNLVNLYVTKARFCEPSLTNGTQLYFRGAQSLFELYAGQDFFDKPIVPKYEQIDMGGGVKKIKPL